MPVCAATVLRLSALRMGAFCAVRRKGRPCIPLDMIALVLM